MGRERERKRADADTETFGVSNVLHLCKCTCRPLPSELNRLSTLQLKVIKVSSKLLSLLIKITYDFGGRDGRKVGGERCPRM